MKRKLLIVGAGVLVLLLIGIAAYAVTRPRVPSNDFQIREVVYGFGDEISQVSLSKTPDEVARDMDMHYAVYIHPDLLAAWKQDPTRALATPVTGPRTDKVEIATVTHNKNGTYTVDASLVAKNTSKDPAAEALKTPVRFTLTQGLDGWQITQYELL